MAPPPIRSVSLSKPDNVWLDSGWAYCVRSLDELMIGVGRLATLQVGKQRLWRGVRNAGWRMESSLQRYLISTFGVHRSGEAAIRATEEKLLALARNWRLDDAGQASDQALLAKLQHAGIPTRLLDTTTDPMTALWFATALPPDQHDHDYGILFCFESSAFPTLSTLSSAVAGPARLSGISDPRGDDWKYQLEDASAQRRPFVLDPLVRDARMTAQNGQFLAGTIPDDPVVVNGILAFSYDPGAPTGDLLGSLCTDKNRPRLGDVSFGAFVIPLPFKAELQFHLVNSFAKSSQTLFPDAAGLKSAIASDPTLLDLGL
jgi:hypothetical protein